MNVLVFVRVSVAGVCVGGWVGVQVLCVVSVY